jgi:SAM-dependent methyltransferase
MAVGPAVLLQLIALSARFRPDGPSLMCGRQKLRRVSGLSRLRLERALACHRPGLRLDDLYQPDGYAERMFDRLGFAAIETLDASPYEAAAQGLFRQHDLNLPVPQDLHGRYAFVYDGGTLEHVFNVPMALANLFNLLRPGGRVVGLNPLNGWPEHGMYQFSAELVYGFWKRMAGCRVLSCRAISQTPGLYDRDIADPQDTGRRTKYRGAVWPFARIPPGRILLQYEVEKLPGSRLSGVAIQPDYAAAWARAGQERVS